MAHRHDHGVDDRPLTTARMQRVLGGAIAALGLVAVIGMVVLWPDGERPELAEELGLGGDLVDATVTASELVACFGTEEAQGILCREIAFEVTSGGTSGDTGVFELPAVEATVDLEDGDGIVLTYQSQLEPRFQYRFYDFQRDVPLAVLGGLFVLAVVALGRWQGLRALLGLVVTGVVMVAFLFPSVLDGNDPTAVALVAAVLIALVALYLTHGVTERTTVALLGTFGALGLTVVLAAVFTSLARFTGFGTEDAYFLQVASTGVDIKGLVLAGIIVGSLGVLDDVTVTQVSAVWQLHQANPTFGARRLYSAAVIIGRDHIASTVNTLVLAYAGASLPLLLLFTQAGRSLVDVAAGELVAVEVVRTLVGSIGLVAAVPLTTALAALVITRGTDGPVVHPGTPPREAARRLVERLRDARSSRAAKGPEADRPPAAHRGRGGPTDAPSDVGSGPDGPADDLGAWERFARGEDP
jgi:uncharacterized membrane protein